MTNLNDFDHALADFLAEGPTRAPEAPVVAALAHARTTPRRPDPLRALRSDVMARPRRIVGLRPGFVVAVVALVGASIGVAVIGSRQPSPPVVVAPTPSAPPKSPLATMRARFEQSIPLNVFAGNPFTLTVIDESGVVFNAESGTPVGDGATVQGVDFAADPSDDRALVVTWVGTACETRARMTVDPQQRTLAIESERCRGAEDLFPYDRVVRLQLSTSVRPDEWSGTVGLAPEPSEPGPSAITEGARDPLGSPAVEPVRVTLPGDPGTAPAVDIVDESGLLVSAVAGETKDGMSFRALDATNDSPNVVRLTWLGAACDTVHRLTIEGALTQVTLDAPGCHGDSIGLDRTLILTFSEPVVAADLQTRAFTGRGGVDMPTWTAVGPDSAGERYDLTVTDLGYRIEAVDAFYDPATEPVEAGRARIDGLDEFNVRLVWNAPACATTFSLDVPVSGGPWQLVSAPCASTTNVLRMVDIALAIPPAAGELDVQTLFGRL